METEELQVTAEGIKDDVLKRTIPPQSFLLRQVSGDTDAVVLRMANLGPQRQEDVASNRRADGESCSGRPRLVTC